MSRENDHNVSIPKERGAPLQSEQNETSEDEIDLRQYAELVRRRWRWIAGITLVAMVLAGIVSFVLPTVFEATATVAVISSSPTETSSVLLSPQAQLTLMTSPDVAAKTVQVVGEALPVAQRDPAVLSHQIQVKPDPVDRSLFHVTAQAPSARLASDVANAWADAGAAALNGQTRDALAQSIAPLEQAKNQAQSVLQVAEMNLKQQERDSQINLLTEQISQTQRTLTFQITQGYSTTLTLNQVQALRQQVQQGQVTLTPEMLLSLQARVGSSDPALLIQPSQLPALNKVEQLEQLNALGAALQAKQAGLNQSVERLTLLIADLQKQVNDQETRLIEPQRTRDTAQANYDTVAENWRQAQARLTQGQNPARVVSHAAPPDAPVSPKPLQNIAIAAGLGLMVSVFGVFAVEYFGAPRAPQTPQGACKVH